MRRQITNWQPVKLTPAHGFSLQTCMFSQHVLNTAEYDMQGSQRLCHTQAKVTSLNPCKGKSLIWGGRRSVFHHERNVIKILEAGSLNILQGESSSNNSVRSWHGNITGLITRYNRLMSCLWGGGDGAKQGLQSTRLIYNSDVAQRFLAAWTTRWNKTRTMTDVARHKK